MRIGAIANLYAQCLVLLLIQQVLPKIAHRLSDVLSISFPFHLDHSFARWVDALNKRVAVLATAEFMRETPGAVVRAAPHKAHESGEVAVVSELDADSAHALTLLAVAIIRRLHDAASCSVPLFQLSTTLCA